MEQGLRFWHAGGTVLRGWALSESGSGTAGLAMLRQGLEAWIATESVTYQTYYLALLAETLTKQGQTEEALKALGDALTLVERSGERLFQAELHRLQGLLLAHTSTAEGQSLAEASFRQAAFEMEQMQTMRLSTLPPTERAAALTKEGTQFFNGLDGVARSRQFSHAG